MISDEFCFVYSEYLWSVWGIKFILHSGEPWSKRSLFVSPVYKQIYSRYAWHGGPIFPIFCELGLIIVDKFEANRIACTFYRYVLWSIIVQISQYIKNVLINLSFLHFLDLAHKMLLKIGPPLWGLTGLKFDFMWHN